MGALKISKMFVKHSVNHVNVQIERYLDLEIQLKRNLESHNNCFLSILSTERRAPSRGTNLLPSLFNCLVKIKYFGGHMPGVFL